MKKIINMLLILLVGVSLTNIPEKRIVAEWEPAIGTMIRWPLGIPSDLVVELASDDVLYVLVENIQQQGSAQSNFENWNVNMNNVVFIFTDTYSHWTRDHGPQFLIGENNWQVINQQFNGYPEENGCESQNNLNNSEYGRFIKSNQRGWDEDDDTNIDFANYMNWDILDLPLYWTGGNFMTDGYGMGFSTQLMVNESNISNSQFKALMEDYLNLDTYHIFENPNFLSIQHIDCMAKLVDSETIIIKQVSQLSPEYNCIENFAESFYELNTFYDRPFEIHRIFCPAINGAWWEVNPVAAYTNSLILNDKVLVPQYGIVQDESALQTFRDAMPGYEVIGFNASNSDPWYGEDALHCRTMGIFDPEMIHISHKSVRENEISQNPLTITSEIIDYGNIDIESVEVFWKYESNDGPFSSFSLVNINDDIYSGQFPFLEVNSGIEYYIHAVNSNQKSVKHPIAGSHTFIISVINGDLNGDLLFNVLDVIILIDYILLSEFNSVGDLNLDNQLNILDVIQLVNLIIE